MLEELRITGLGVIDDTTLRLSSGMNVITGETGAGKTMVVTGLGLLFGGRADAGRVRADPGRAVVEGRLKLGGTLGDAVRTRITDAGGEADDDGSVLLSRTVTAEGRSRAHVGGRSMPVSTLSELGEQILAVHGQSDQLRLLRPSEQRSALDRFAGPEHEKLLESYREAFGRWRSVVEDLADRRRNARQRSQEADLLKLGLDEITRVDPQPGEDDDLRNEVQRLEHAEGLRVAATLAGQALAGGVEVADDTPDATQLLGLARRTLEGQAQVDPSLADLAARIEEAATLVGDVSSELSAYLGTLDADPARLEAIYERRAALRGLTRKYADDIDGVIAWAEHAKTKLSELDTSDELLEELDRERQRLEASVAELAGRLTAARREAAGRFSEAVSVELAGLAMPHARVEVAVLTRAPSRDEPAVTVDGATVAAGADGADEVELRLLAHPGAPALPLQKGASGGELSRVMLAIEVVFAGAGGPPTLVFDEVDSGVGGTAAVEIGKRLARLARTHQVLVVTHLPQVAAFADRHLVVAKDTGGAITTSGVRIVEETERARELSRMLAGLPDSDLGIAHAEELLSVAAREKRAA
ncbi:DNA repair protein RecN (Recombination protein N) [Actinoplanes campanulatus]|uniref:DNA repair protein RecN n=1 Tax=Actinoplanes campanulatus TaxID=113559 RepID=A0A7W5FF45_9ACTN|nr:DNA repair protein RecN [Actinoplanes campanulatus]MBB3096218.1 DNA repair protein RecN (Recombination protein N) [Actinoplanes campanulatus]GGN51052.1 DNA repair protein RecN [Actinoplanes campanulatus]GID42532.1 DNA repair protein RecN [Actinoplanes campanulatus]